MEFLDWVVRLKGGSGSGNFNHAGIQDHQGGSQTTRGAVMENISTCCDKMELSTSDKRGLSGSIFLDPEGGLWKIRRAADHNDAARKILDKAKVDYDDDKYETSAIGTVTNAGFARIYTAYSSIGIDTHGLTRPQVVAIRKYLKRVVQENGFGLITLNDQVNKSMFRSTDVDMEGFNKYVAETVKGGPGSGNHPLEVKTKGGDGSGGFGHAGVQGKKGGSLIGTAGHVAVMNNGKRRWGARRRSKKHGNISGIKRITSEDNE